MTAPDGPILVTGGTGLLGHGLQSATRERSESTYVFVGHGDCDLTVAAEVNHLFEDVRPKAVIQAAALSGGIGLSRAYPATLLRTNLLIDLNVVDAAHRYGVEKTVLSLSNGMYPTGAPLPIHESSIHDGVPHEAAESYAFAKRIIDPLIRSYHREFGLCVVGAVPTGIFGEHDHFHPQEGSMLASLIRRFHENRNGNGPIVVWGDGTPMRQYTYAPDLARAYIWMLDHYDDPQILNVGSSEEHSIRDIASMVADAFGIDRGRIAFDESKPSGASRRNTDVSRFEKLSQIVFTPFRKALARTVRWYVDTAESDPENLRTQSKIRIP